MERRNEMKRNKVLNNNNDEVVSPSTTKYETKINAFAVSEKDAKIWRRTLVRQPANKNRKTVQFKPTSKEQRHIMVKKDRIPKDLEQHPWGVHQRHWKPRLDNQEDRTWLSYYHTGVCG